MIRIQDLEAYGLDLFYNTGPFVFQAEYDWFIRGLKTGSDLYRHAWFVQGGYLLCEGYELTARYQSLSGPVNLIDGANKVDWVSVGVNKYIRGHNLKIQADFTCKDEVGTEVSNDAFQLQLQLDF